MADRLTTVDPLTALPPEIILRVLDFTPISALACLTATSSAWHQFIDDTHQQAIYSAPSKTSQPPKKSQPLGARDFGFLTNSTSFSSLFADITSWKDLCQLQTLLARNWASPQPVTRESVLLVGNNAVWRFKADFKRRFFISTSYAGGLNVSDMDTGRLLWRLPSTLDTTSEGDAVRPYAHLEYQDGMAVFDREGEAVEVWQTDQEGTARGVFERVAIIDHDCDTRGFQLSYWSLVVVSTEGQGFVYNMKQSPPKLMTHMVIEQDAVGHVDQSEDVVVYSMGTRGYHVYDKQSGERLGILQPSHCTEKYHVQPIPRADTPLSSATLAQLYRGPVQRICPPTAPRKNRLTPIQLSKGPLPNLPSDPNHIRNSEDEWGAGMLDRNSDLFIGVSRSGRVFVCSNFRKALQDGPESLAFYSQILECDSDGSGFDLGGWLSVRDHRIMFEIKDRVYIVALDKDNRIRVENEDGHVRASYSLLTSSAPQLAVPVSYMALFDDAIMTTYTTLARREHGRIAPTKAIRIISLAPDRHGSGYSIPNVTSPWHSRWSEQANIMASQDLSLQLLIMLAEAGDAHEDEERVDEDNWAD
ncbi:hypothetical protein BDW02DRAFT_582842 [Decorospora gaudefroyi]|uniref:F-box domain-containing protein n=1 Tax=Decorospora gaudefroyi TaxID=184978 RepID=A0A6A5KAR7_9PLEO|nr:hypothetical protein BDW02DRAFT_582842 [Decorospora gaudefroyi]